MPQGACKMEQPRSVPVAAWLSQG